MNPSSSPSSSGGLLDGAVVLVTGMGPGLGQELAYALSREGARLALCCRTASELERIAGEVEATGAEVLTRVTDVTDPDAVAGLVTATVDPFGRIDEVVNSAYDPGPFGPFAEADLDLWRSPIEVNVFGALNVVQAALPHLRASKGAVVNVNSMVHRKPLPGQAAYGTSKAALAGATKMLARDLGPEGIRVNSVFFGWMWGPPVAAFVDHMAATTGASADAVVAGIAADIPLGRIPDDAECADTVVFLVSRLSRAVTGASLDVNAGEFMP